MYQFSYWEQKHFWKYSDFTIIGSGITGLTTALNLRKLHPKSTITILERGMLPSGASTKNAGFACFGSPSEILDDLNHSAESEVFEMIRQRFYGIEALRKLMPDRALGFSKVGGYEIFTTSDDQVYQECLASLSYLNAELVNTIGMQLFKDATRDIGRFGFSGIAHLLVNEDEGTVDTGLMMKNLIALARKENIDIYNSVEVKSMNCTGNRAILDTNFGELQAGFAIVATNGFAKKLLPEIDVKPARAQVLVTSKIKDLNLKGCFHHDRGYNYFREIDGRVLLGGGRHQDKNSEETEEMSTTSSIQDYLENLLNEYIIPNRDFTIDYRWSGIMGVGNSKKVILQKLGPSALCAVRFGGMGIALGAYVGRQAAEMTLG